MGITLFTLRSSDGPPLCPGNFAFLLFRLFVSELGAMLGYGGVGGSFSTVCVEPSVQLVF